MPSFPPRLLLLVLLSVTVLACDPAPESAETVTETPDATAPVAAEPAGDPNPAAPGFNLEDSDPRAIAIADSVVAYHGGRAAYDRARFFRWNFFGARTLYWDKRDARVRIEAPGDNMVYLLNYGGDTLSGMVRQRGDRVTDPDSLARFLDDAYGMFINDSYWLVQPFKLKDSGVTLRYVDRKIDPQNNRPSHILDLTFSGVGKTPQNRYRLWIDGVTYRINTWQFFRTAQDQEPAMETPYLGYRPYEGVWLSEDRGGRFQLKGISVSNEMDERLFTEF